MGAHIFVSYAREDSAYVERLVAFLARAGVSVWRDDEIPTGRRWEQVLTERIETCAALFVVMSPAAARSEWVARRLATPSSGQAGAAAAVGRLGDLRSG